MFERTISPKGPYRSKELAPGIRLASLHPGGINGPNDEISMATPGGQGWAEMVMLGGRDDDFMLSLPDIRMPPNQYWPMHWHDCWTVVLVVEGQCLIGDWWLDEGDIFIAEPSIEYGPLLTGPKGVRLFEIFSQAHLAEGGYGPEYHDHPTLKGSPGRQILPRSEINRRNEGHQSLTCDTEGMQKTKLSPGAQWDLGASDDPDRGVMRSTRLAAGEAITPRGYGDWHMIVVLDGSIAISGETLKRDDYLVIQPDSRVGEIVAGSDGAQLLELSRTARALEIRMVRSGKLSVMS